MVIGVKHLNPVNIILVAALVVIKEVPGWGGGGTGSKSQGEVR
jgi:hypothetical protein